MQSVIAIRRAIESGRTTPRAAIAACLDAIEERDGAIGAFEKVGSREKLLAAADSASGPLAGIAVGIKDIFATHDLPTGYGTSFHAGYRPTVDAPLVAMLRRAGASIIGKTVTTELAFLQPAGTRNPHNTAHTPGGSSSGSAAAVAAGMVPAATGTQTGGSIVRPAAYCGIAGYKPSFRLLPTGGMKTFAWTLDTVGFFAASAADVAAIAAAATGRDLQCRPMEARKLRIGLFWSANWNEASADMQAALLALTGAAREAGARVVEIDEPAELTAGREAHAIVQGFEVAHALAGDFDLFADRMSEILVKTLKEGAAITPNEYDDARRIARSARRSANALFDQVDILLTPSAPGAAPAGLDSTGSPIFNKVWTLTGNPCVNVPGLADGAGLPLGVQVVSRFGRDQLALSVAAWLERLTKMANGH